jgi:hypothetical protein
LALTAPGPIAFAHCAEKIQGVVQAAAREREVKMFNFGGVFEGDAQSIANTASPIWLKLESLIKDAMTGDKFTSAVVDTDTEAWELCRLAFFGELNPKGRTDSNYGPVNARWRTVFKNAQRSAYNDNALLGVHTRPNLIVIGQAKDEYTKTQANKQGERTGRLLQAGQKEMAYNADVVIETSRDASNGDFIATIRKGWWNAAAVEGYEFRNEDITFAKIMALITETSEDEW